MSVEDLSLTDAEYADFPAEVIAAIVAGENCAVRSDKLRLTSNFAELYLAFATAYLASKSLQGNRANVDRTLSALVAAYNSPRG